MAVGFIAMWLKNQHKVERLNEKDSEQDRQHQAMWKWKDLHEKESAQIREQLHREIAELKGSQLVFGEQYKQIIAFLQDLKERMIKLENK